ncbi:MULTISPECIES: hypothetical protein [Legionella]|uniref:hypothetical protein n=1 Tax=Legionella TaxID=445 RepID=UPI00096289A6|nr:MULTISPECIES: hypothetical protein [Legionella]MBN9227972.1 hypothetical protein [Legionella steelei]OJW16300.1 MAG: hypothetical protein BGO44_01570 [Legionella sp. 39-23]
MLYLLGEKELYYIFDGQTVSEIASRALTTYRNRPGFFTPYRDGYEFVGELIAPGLYPFAGLALAGYSALAFVGSAVVCIGAYLVAAGAFLFNATGFRDDALKFAGSALHFTGIALFESAVGFLLALISFPHSLLSIVTRAAATVIAAGSEPSAEQERIDAEGPDEYTFQLN